jgi:hypothetical protein
MLIAPPSLPLAGLSAELQAALDPWRRPLEKLGRDAAALAGGALQYNDNLELYSATITTPDDWQAITFLNSWVTYDATLAPAYRKDDRGAVWVKGRAKSGTTGAIFNLLTAYRPPDQLLLVQRGAGGFASVQVDAAGDVKIIDGGNTDLSLNFSFTAADRRPALPAAASGGYPVSWVTGVRGDVQNVVCWSATESPGAGKAIRSTLQCVWDTAVADGGRTRVNVRLVPGLAPLQKYSLVFAVFGR